VILFDFSQILWKIALPNPRLNNRGLGIYSFKYMHTVIFYKIVGAGFKPAPTGQCLNYRQGFSNPYLHIDSRGFPTPAGRTAGKRGKPVWKVRSADFFIIFTLLNG
jgi:hypothetical protein